MSYNSNLPSYMYRLYNLLFTHNHNGTCPYYCRCKFQNMQWPLKVFWLLRLIAPKYPQAFAHFINEHNSNPGTWIWSESLTIYTQVQTHIRRNVLTQNFSITTYFVLRFSCLGRGLVFFLVAHFPIWNARFWSTPDLWAAVEI